MRVMTLHKACKILAAFWDRSESLSKTALSNTILHTEINDVFLKRSTNQHWELLENTIWPPVWSIAAEVAKTRRRLLKQHYRKPLTRESINTPATPIESAVVTSLCVWGITSHCLLPIRVAAASHEKQSLTHVGVSMEKQGRNMLVWRGKQVSSPQQDPWHKPLNSCRMMSFDLFFLTLLKRSVHTAPTVQI